MKPISWTNHGFCAHCGDSFGLTRTLVLVVPFGGANIVVQVQATNRLTPAHLARIREYLVLAEEDITGNEKLEDAQ